MHSYTKTYGDKMNAKEFIKKFGWEKAISVRNDFCDGFYLFSLANGFVDRIAGFQLSEYIDAYELINNCGGLFGAKCDLDSIEYNLRCNVFHGYEKLNMQSYATNLKQAITLVEKINE